MSRRLTALVVGSALMVLLASVAFAQTSDDQVEPESDVVESPLVIDEDEIVEPEPTDLCDDTGTDGTDTDDTDTDGGTDTDGTDGTDTDGCEEDAEVEEETDEAGDDADGSAENHGKAVSTAAHCKGLTGRARGTLVSSVARDKSATVESAQAACDAALAEQAVTEPAATMKKAKPVKPAKATKTVTAPRVERPAPAPKEKPAPAATKPVKAPKSHPNKP